jgi:hypothetical protein
MFFLLILGIVTISISSFCVSSYLAIIGVTFIFWGSILLYLAPSRQIPLALLTYTISVSMENIERLLTEHQCTQKAIYLPPKNLQSPESSIAFIPKKLNQGLPRPEEVEINHLFSNKQEGLFLTPPGYALLKMFEQKLGRSFIKLDQKDTQKNLSRLFVEELAIAETVKIQIQNRNITVEVSGSIFKDECQVTQKYPTTHNSLGCLLTSSLACVLAKIIGKPIVVESEEQSQDAITTIQYQILEI